MEKGDEYLSPSRDINHNRITWRNPKKMKSHPNLTPVTGLGSRKKITFFGFFFTNFRFWIFFKAKTQMELIIPIEKSIIPIFLRE